ncbi:MAG: hypothetical protein V1824_04630, partial [archaeon]
LLEEKSLSIEEKLNDLLESIRLNPDKDNIENIKLEIINIINKLEKFDTLQENLFEKVNLLPETLQNNSNKLEKEINYLINEFKIINSIQDNINLIKEETKVFSEDLKLSINNIENVKSEVTNFNSNFEKIDLIQEDTFIILKKINILLENPNSNVIDIENIQEEINNLADKLEETYLLKKNIENINLLLENSKIDLNIKNFEDIKKGIGYLIGKFEHISLIQKDSTLLLEKVNILLENSKLNSSIQDIEDIKKDFENIILKFAELQNYIDFLSIKNNSSLKGSLFKIDNKLENRFDRVEQLVNKNIGGSQEFEINVKENIDKLLTLGENQEFQTEFTNSLNKNFDEIKIISENFSQKINFLKDEISKIQLNLTEFIENDEISNDIKNDISLIKEIIEENNKETKQTLSEKINLFEEQINSLSIMFIEYRDFNKELNYINKIEILAKNFDEFKEQIINELNKINIAQDIDFIKGELYSSNSNINELNNLINNLVKKNDSNLVSIEIKSLSEKTISILDNLNKKTEDLLSNDKTEIILNNLKLINTNEKIEDLKNLIINLSLNNALNPITDNLIFIKNKLDNLEELSQNNNNNSIPDLMELLKNDIISIKEFFNTQNNDLKDVINSDLNLSLNNTLNPVIELLKKDVISIDEKIFGLKKQFNTQNNFLKEEINSFIEKFKDIQNNIESTFNKITSLILTPRDIFIGIERTVNDFNNISENTNLKVNDILERTNNIGNNLIQINNFLKKINTEIINLPKEDNTKENIYDSLKDIDLNSESLLEKMDLTQNQVQIINSDFNNLKVQFHELFNKFEEINNNTSNISLKTNKLILKSGEDSNLLKSNIDKFKQLIEKIETNIEHNKDNLQNTVISNFNEFKEIIQNIITSNIETNSLKINNKLENIQKNNSINEETVLNNLTSLNSLFADYSKTSLKDFDKLTQDFGQINSSFKTVFDTNETFKKFLLQIAEWIDSAGTLLEETNTNVEIIKNNNESDKSNEILSELTKMKNIIVQLTEKNENDKNIQLEQIQNINNLELEKNEQIKESLNIVEKELKDNVFIKLKQIDEIVRENFEKNCTKNDINLTNTKIENIDNNLSKIFQENLSILNTFSNYREETKAIFKELNQNLLGKINSSLENIYPVEQFEKNINQLEELFNNKFNEVNNKINGFELYFENFEKNINEIIDNTNNNKNNDETKQILEFIAGRVNAICENNKDNTFILKKIDILEKKLSNLDNNFEKIVNLLGEE